MSTWSYWMLIILIVYWWILSPMPAARSPQQGMITAVGSVGRGGEVRGICGPRRISIVLYIIYCTSRANRLSCMKTEQRTGPTNVPRSQQADESNTFRAATVRERSLGHEPIRARAQPPARHSPSTDYSGGGGQGSDSPRGNQQPVRRTMARLSPGPGFEP